VKDNNGEKGDCDARYDEVDGVEERLAADGDVERDIWLRLRAAVVPLDVLARRHVENVPLDAAVELFQINAVMNHVGRPWAVLLLVNVVQVDLQTRTKVSK